MCVYSLILMQSGGLCAGALRNNFLFEEIMIFE